MEENIENIEDVQVPVQAPAVECGGAIEGEIEVPIEELEVEAEVEEAPVEIPVTEQRARFYETKRREAWDAEHGIL